MSRPEDLESVEFGGNSDLLINSLPNYPFESCHDPEGWNGEGGGRRVQDGEHM